MRVAYICADPGVPVFGRKGASVHVQEVIRALQKQGAQVELFAMNLDGTPPADFQTMRIHSLPPVPKAERAVRERKALVANRDLRTALVREGSFDLVYERYSLWSFAGMDYARAAKVPGLLEVNAPLIAEQQQHRGLVDRTSAEQVAEWVFRDATALIAVSEEVKGYLERYPAARGRIYVVPNGVNPDRFPVDLRPSYPGRPGAFTVGFVGTLKPWHGLQVLVEAFASLHGHDSGARLLIVGDGPERDRLAASLAARGLADAVRFTGGVAPEEIPGWLASMDVAVAPYPELAHFYFSPLKVYEYMAAGLAVVASRVGQLAELIQDGVNGLLCRPGDSLALAAALAQLRVDPELRGRLGHAGRMTVLRHHTWDGVAQHIFSLAGLELNREEVNG